MICPTCKKEHEEKHDLKSITNNKECIACMLTTIDAQIKRMRERHRSPTDSPRPSTSDKRIDNIILQEKEKSK